MISSNIIEKRDYLEISCKFLREPNELSHLADKIVTKFLTDTLILAGIYLLKDFSKNTRTRCGICSKLTIKTPERLDDLLITLSM